jgi:hypothetical protein
MGKRKESYFWTSYADLMTSLFFIMLVLFCIVCVILQKRYEIQKNKYDAIERVVKSTKELGNNKYFEYNKQYEKYRLKINVFFPEKESDFKWLTQETKDRLNDVGDTIVNFFKKHKENKYLLIVEGQASINNANWMDRNYTYSFERAKNLMKYWIQEQDKKFGDNCEIQIAGSGDGRLNPNSMRENGTNEKNNQRFLIYILPKNIIPD